MTPAEHLTVFLLRYLSVPFCLYAADGQMPGHYLAASYAHRMRLQANMVQAGI